VRAATPESAPAPAASHPWCAGNCSCISGIPTIHGAAGISSILDADILLTALLGTSE
jgi:hypothetical protein